MIIKRFLHTNLRGLALKLEEARGHWLRGFEEKLETNKKVLAALGVEW
jgi:hypothetical protein